MKILVTGASGFIGSHLCKELEAAEHLVYRASLPDFNLREPETFARLLRFAKPELVIHLAAKVGRLFGEDDVQETVADNAGMTALVAKACGEHGVRLAYASTSEVYGDQGDKMCVEGWRYDGLPHNAYGLSKRWGEEACRLYSPGGLMIWRIAMPYGPGLPAGRGRAAIVNMLHQALHRQPIPVHRGAERSWCWIGDTVRALRLTIEQTDGGIFNVGRDDDPRTMLEVARLACDLTGAPHDLIHEVDPPARQTVVKRLSTERIRRLGWRPEVPLEEGMARTLDAVRQLPVAA